MSGKDTSAMVEKGTQGCAMVFTHSSSCFKPDCISVLSYRFYQSWSSTEKSVCDGRGYSAGSFERDHWVLNTE